MEERYFILCKTCETAEWIGDDELIEYIEEHEGHTFAVMPPDVEHNEEAFRRWIIKFMGWPEEAEG